MLADINERCRFLHLPHSIVLSNYLIEINSYNYTFSFHFFDNGTIFIRIESILKCYMRSS